MAREVLVILRGDPSVDPRPYRFIDVLSKESRVTVFSHPLSQPAEWRDRVKIEVFRRQRVRFFRRVSDVLYRLIRSGLVGSFGGIFHRGLLRFEGFPLQRGHVRQIFVFDPEFLFLAKSWTGAQLHFDAREYYPGQLRMNSLENRLNTRQVEKVLTSFVRYARTVSTVGKGLQSLYKANFGIDATLLPSYPVLQPLDDETVPLAESGPLRLVHHGIANPERSISRMIEAVEQAGPRFYLDLYLTGQPIRIQALREICRRSERVRVLPPVAYREIGSMLRNYHLGIHFVPGEMTTNLRLGMPNKLFEFLEAGLPVLCSPSMIEMSEFIRARGVGLSAEHDTVPSLVELLKSLNPSSIRALREKVLDLREEIDWASTARPNLLRVLGNSVMQ